MKYGKEPYPHAVKPIKSKYITYVTLNSYLKKKLEEWCEHDIDVKVQKNTYDFNLRKDNIDIRKQLNINYNDILIARTTRIIPQKRLDRDIYIIYQLNFLFKNNDIKKKVFLVIAGDFYENYSHYLELINLIKKLKVESFVKFIGYLHHKYIPRKDNKITIEDLYYSCDIVSFLTSWDYDSYGNPIGEAISNQKCYITTSYEYYYEVYGKYGFEAPIMEISENNDNLPDETFINDLYMFINNKEQMHNIAKKNFLIGKEILSDPIIDFCI